VVTVLIAGGGTGGHVFPMLAVGDALQRIDPSASVLYVGTPRGIETRVVPEAGGVLEQLDIAPLRGGGAAGFAKGAFKAVRGLVASRSLVAQSRPDVCLTVGGYAGGPVALVARLMGVPLAIIEPNSVLGMTNRILSPLADRAYTAFGDVDARFAPGVAMRVGVPLRKSFEPAPYVSSSDRFRVLVLGGSLGARALNERMPAAAATLAKAVPHARVLHQAGRGRAAETAAAYAAAGLEPGGPVEVTEFIGDVGAELRRADVSVQRCGASSLAELCAVGRASVLVPFPFAADQHQLENARSLEREGAAVAIEQEEATPARLAEVLIGLASRPEQRSKMADRARALGRPDAAHAVAVDLLRLAAAGSGRRRRR
jgi:UDP-N-acetylglucosamine--N-acetylmuramyl-(pentapeptide) pyrophosphoryl-undecaprenol N-acetylglucosamine transferase